MLKGAIILRLQPLIPNSAYCFLHWSHARPCTPILQVHCPNSSLIQFVFNTEPVVLHSQAEIELML